MVSGPLCASTLADQGADVIKVETRTGDHMRHSNSSAHGLASSFISCNRGKRSIAMNLKCDEGREILWKLVLKADVFIQNFRPGAIERLGFGEPQVRERNARIVYVSISGVGESGPYAGKRVYDPVIQALSGMADNRQLRLDLVSDELRGGTRADWLQALEQADVPCAPVLRRREVIDDPQVRNNELVVEFDHPHVGRVRQVRPAARFDRSPTAIAGPAPVLGEHTRSILRDLDYGDEAIDDLMNAGVVGAAQ